VVYLIHKMISNAKKLTKHDIVSVHCIYSRLCQIKSNSV